MKVLLVNGSPKELDGCAEVLREAAAVLNEAEVETELFWPVRKDVPCSNCGACRGSGVCVNDPRPADFLRAAADCDGFLFASPADLFGLSVGMRQFLERALQLAARRARSPLSEKPAAAVVVCRRGNAARKQMAQLLREAGLSLPEEAIAVLGEAKEKTPRETLRLAVLQLIEQNKSEVR